MQEQEHFGADESEPSEFVPALKLPSVYRGAALQEKRIRGAALDVTEVEPLPEDSPLYELDNVLLSPHCADRTADFQVRAWHRQPAPHSHDCNQLGS